MMMKMGVGVGVGLGLGFRLLESASPSHFEGRNPIGQEV